MGRKKCRRAHKQCTARSKDAIDFTDDLLWFLNITKDLTANYQVENFIREGQVLANRNRVDQTRGDGIDSNVPAQPVLDKGPIGLDSPADVEYGQILARHMLQPLGKIPAPLIQH